MSAPAIGRIVHYTLSEADARSINDARIHGGGDAHGNHVLAGDVCPAMIVRTFDGPAANLQVFLDGDGSHWATSRTEGEGPGTWAWPMRV